MHACHALSCAVGVADLLRWREQIGNSPEIPDGWLRPASVRAQADCRCYCGIFGVRRVRLASACRVWAGSVCIPGAGICISQRAIAPCTLPVYLSWPLCVPLGCLGRWDAAGPVHVDHCLCASPWLGLVRFWYSARRISPWYTPRSVGL